MMTSDYQRNKEKQGPFLGRPMDSPRFYCQDPSSAPARGTETPQATQPTNKKERGPQPEVPSRPPQAGTAPCQRGPHRPGPSLLWELRRWRLLHPLNSWDHWLLPPGYGFSRSTFGLLRSRAGASQVTSPRNSYSRTCSLSYHPWTIRAEQQKRGQGSERAPEPHRGPWHHRLLATARGSSLPTQRKPQLEGMEMLSSSQPL